MKAFISVLWEAAEMKVVSGGHTSNKHSESFILFKQSQALSPDWPPTFSFSVRVPSNGWTKSKEFFLQSAWKGFHERNWNSVTTFSMAMYKPLIKQYKFKKKYIHCQTCHYSKRMCSKQAVLELRPCSLTDLLPMVTGRIALLPKRFSMTVGHAGPIWWWK